MKIKYVKKTSKGVRSINFYTDEKDKKIDSEGNLYTNYQIKYEKDRNKTVSEFVSLVRGVINRVKAHKLTKIAFDIQQIRDIKVDGIDEDEKMQLFLKNISLAEYVFDKYKTEKKGRIDFVEIVGKITKNEKDVFLETEILNEGIKYARDFANTPAQDMTPTIFSNEIKKMFKGVKNISIKVLEDKDTEKLKMGLYNAVGRGSDEKSKFIIINYKGGKSKDKPEVMVGKGVCYDTGGLSLKPGKAMLEMHMDMTGASVVASALYVLAKNEVKKNIIAVIPTVENAISAKAYRPGDILTAYDKTTVEIKNTDAEGRLILADAISYSLDKFKPNKIVDVATLTGASLIAVGQKSSVILTNSKKMEEDFREIGERTFDRVWPLPTWDDFKANISSNFADIANLGKNSYGGVITAGMFLKYFVDKKNDKKDIEWTHIDMAPRMDSAPGEGLAPGSVGEPLHLLVEYFAK